MDRILTDEDFRQIRRLIKKKEEEDDRKNRKGDLDSE
jgi:hypothetical protein